MLVLGHFLFYFMKRNIAIIIKKKTTDVHWEIGTVQLWRISPRRTEAVNCEARTITPLLLTMIQIAEKAWRRLGDLLRNQFSWQVWIREQLATDLVTEHGNKHTWYVNHVSYNKGIDWIFPKLFISIIISFKGNPIFIWNLLGPLRHKALGKVNNILLFPAFDSFYKAPIRPYNEYCCHNLSRASILYLEIFEKKITKKSAMLLILTWHLGLSFPPT